jgi:hypothetical protein
MTGFITKAATWLGERRALVGALAVGGLAAVLYARTVNLGFFGDDPSGHFRWIEQVPWPQWFTSSPAFFLRPLVFVVYRLLWLILGGYSAPAYHLVPLLLHVSNTVMLGLLGASLTRRNAFGWLAALLFATFPLSHEAVAGADALAHPLVTFWALLAVLLYARGRRTGSKPYLWAVWPVVLLGLLTHENGLIIPVLILSLELIYFPPRTVRDLLRSPALYYFALPALYLLWWLRIPKTTTAAPHTFGAVLQNTLPFLQAAAYPLLPFIRLQVTDWLLLIALVFASLAATYAAARALGTVRLWLFALVWAAIAAIPSILFLDWDYLHGAPHLYYLAAVGVALLWAAVPLGVARLAKGSVARRAAADGAAALLVAAMLLPPVRFIQCHLDLWVQATRLVRLVSARASTAPAGRDLIYVNLPAYFTSNPQHPRGCPSTYPFVTTGVVIFPPYADLREFIRVNGGPDRPARAITLADYDPDWPPRYGDPLAMTTMRDTLQRNQVYVFEIGNWSLRDLSAVWEPDAPRTQPPVALFGDALALEAAAAQQDPGQLVVTLKWRLQSVPSQPLTAFVHVYDSAGRLLAQHDGPLGRSGAPADYVPASAWQAGDRIQDVHAIPLQSPLPSDGYTIAVGLYDSATVQRLTARTPEGAALPDNLYMVGR